jgi:iron complex transport system permease protein
MWVVTAAAVLFAAVVAAMTTGPADIGVGPVLVELVDRLPFVDTDSGLSEQARNIVWDVRLPRVVLGLLVGSMLSLSGGAYQGVFRNPLADPYLLGAAAGAGLGATVVIVVDVGRSIGPVEVLPLAAFVGAVAAVLLTYVVGALGDRRRSTATLLLAGVAVASLLTAIQTFLQQRDADTVREVYAWILGRLTVGGWDEVWLLVPYGLVSAAVILVHRRALDVLSVGDDEATTLGLPVDRTRLIVVMAASLGTGAAVAVSGLIGFVGIIVPHTVRLVAGSSYRIVLPLSVLVGGAFLVFADLLARTLLAPAEIPIGVITAFFGAPFFVVLLRLRRSVAV